MQQEKTFFPGLPTLNEGDEPVPGFRLIRCRGRGGFGEVWEAEAAGGFLVALKFIPLSARARAAEVRALELVRAIHHPNLLVGFGAWQVAETLVVGMELADGSLWDRFVEANDQGLSGIPRLELLGYLGEAAAGVDYLNGSRHSVDGRAGLGIQHRDIKPPNILLFGGGAKVADLGMARAIEGELGGHTGIWTYPFAAPEFFRGQTARQSDQYGMAATYCQLRTGRLPFRGNAAEVTAGHMFGAPDLSALPEPERPIVARALAKIPGDRWPDCRSFFGALRALGQDVPELLYSTDGEDQDIPRAYRSSTGSMASLATGSGPVADAPSRPRWRPFESTDSQDGLLDTPHPDPFPIAPAGEVSGNPRNSVDTAISPSDPEPAPPIHPPEREPSKASRRWPTRIGQFAVVATLATATVLVIAGIRPSTVEEKSRRSPSPDRVVGLVSDGPERPDNRSDIPAAATPPSPVTEKPAAVIEPVPDPVPADPIPPSTPPAIEKVNPEIESAPAQPEADLILTSITPSRPAPPDIAAPHVESPPQQPKPATTPDPTPPIQLEPVLEGPSDLNLPSSKVIEPPSPKGPEPVNPPDPTVIAPPTPKGPEPEPQGKKGPGTLEKVPQEVTPPTPRPVPTQEIAVVPAINKEPRPVVTPSPAATEAPPATPGPFANASKPLLPHPVRTVPVTAEAAHARGVDFLERESFIRAVAEFDQAIRLDPAHVASYYPRAVARHRAGDPQGALKDYDEAIRLRLDDAPAYIGRGFANYELGAFDRAIADFDQAIRLRPADADARLRRGLARYRSGDYPGSIVDFNEVLRLDPRNVRAAEFRAEALSRSRLDPGLLALPNRPGVPSRLLPPGTPNRAVETMARGVVTPSPSSPPFDAAGRPVARSNNSPPLAAAYGPGGRVGPAEAQAREAEQARRQGQTPNPNAGPQPRRKPQGRGLLQLFGRR